MPLIDLALVIGVLFTVGVYLVLEKHLLSILFGVSLLSNAGNLFVLSVSGGPENKRSPIVPQEGAPGLGPMVDPLPQALILTAIVIGSGILCYCIFLIFRLHQEHKTTDLEAILRTPGEGEALK